MKNFTTIYIVRHGETEWNVQKLLQGQSDSPLTAKGEEQAKKVGQELAHIHFDNVFSSDLGRTIRTAELILLEKKLAVKTTQLLRERNFGKHEGVGYEAFESEIKDLLKEYEKLSDKEKKKFKFSDEYETDDEIVARFITFLREVGVSHACKTILVVSHGAMMKSLLIHLGFGTYQTLHHSSVKNGGYIKLQTDGVEFEIAETKGVIKVVEEASSS